MSALFNFNSFLTVVLLVICTCTYIKIQFPAILNDRTGFRGFFWKAARIGICSSGITGMVYLLPIFTNVTDFFRRAIEPLGVIWVLRYGDINYLLLRPQQSSS